MKKKKTDLMRCFVTGCAGFIGSNLVDRLLIEGHDVVGYDNFSTGQLEFLTQAQQSSHFMLVNDDILNMKVLIKELKNVDIVFHFAANADVRFGSQNTFKDLEQNMIGTFNVLETMRLNKIKRIVFASTSSVYGESKIIPTPENVSFPVQTSFYGASKNAAEGLIAAYCEAFDFQAYIFRFTSVLGERYSHGHIFDFIKQIQNHPNFLNILGDGKQQKSYIYVQDCIDAMLFAIKKAKEKINIFNLGTDDYYKVSDSVNLICDYLGISPKYIYGNEDRGWIGDNPFVYLDCSCIHTLGWYSELTIKDAIIHTVDFLQENKWLLERRK